MSMDVTIVSYQNESCLACPHPPSSYGGRREQEGSSHFDKNSHFDRTLRYNPFNERFLDRAMKQIQLLNKLGHGTICVFKLVPSEGWI